VTTEWLILFGLSALAVWRISYMLVSERGFLGFAQQLRQWAGTYTEVDERGRAYSKGELGKLLECVYCTSVWIALPFAICLGKTADLAWMGYGVTWLALSALAIQFNRGM
jgi:hypothetical protein